MTTRTTTTTTGSTKRSDGNCKRSEKRNGSDENGPQPAAMTIASSPLQCLSSGPVRASHCPPLPAQRDERVLGGEVEAEDVGIPLLVRPRRRLERDEVAC